MRFGVEVEVFVYEKREDCSLFQPVDVYHWLDCPDGRKVPGIGVFSTDAGLHQLEWSLEPVNNLEQLKKQLESASNYFPKKWNLIFQGEDSLATTEFLPWAPKPRYKAIIDALSLECPNNYQEVLKITRYSATHIHLELNPVSKEGLKVLNFLNNWAPLIGKLFANSHPFSRLNKAWRGWADWRRLPGPWWFKTPEELCGFVNSIPKLIIQDKNEWVPYLKPTQIPDPIHEGTIWWWCRPRWTLGTIEFRALDSLPPEILLQAVKFVLNLVEIILKEENLPRLDEEEWWQMPWTKEEISCFFEEKLSISNPLN